MKNGEERQRTVMVHYASLRVVSGQQRTIEDKLSHIEIHSNAKPHQIKRKDAKTSRSVRNLEREVRGSFEISRIVNGL